MSIPMRLSFQHLQRIAAALAICAAAFLPTASPDMGFEARTSGRCTDKSGWALAALVAAPAAGAFMAYIIGQETGLDLSQQDTAGQHTMRSRAQRSRGEYSNARGATPSFCARTTSRASPARRPSGRV